MPPRPGTFTPAIRLPFEPLQRVVASRVVMRRHTGAKDGLTLLWPTKSWQYAAYERAKQAGWITLHAADRLAVDLGLHPALIWPQWFDVDGRLGGQDVAGVDQANPAGR